MKYDWDPKLESLVDAELKKLPPLRAPASLVPRVMAVLAARSSPPWWRRSWWDWPLAAQAAFFLLGLTIAGVFSGGSVLLDDGVAAYSQQITEHLAPAGTVWDTAVTLGSAAVLLLKSATQPFLFWVLLVAGLLYLVCVAVGTACVRLALNRR